MSLHPPMSSPQKSTPQKGTPKKGTQESKEAYYITTAISYPNGAPHIGHAYEAIATDVLARFMELDGRDVACSAHRARAASALERAQTRPLCSPRVEGR